MLRTFARLMTESEWKPLPNCPGRFILVASPSPLTPRDLIGTTGEVQEFKVAAAKDVVVVSQLLDGGLISYKRENGTYVHTLNTRDGFARKLCQLGLLFDPSTKLRIAPSHVEGHERDSTIAAGKPAGLRATGSGQRT